MLSKNIQLFNNNKTRYKQITHHTALEVVWTIVPAVILLIVSVPSFALLYAMDEITKPLFTLKAIGRQWFWSYEYGDSVFLNNSRLGWILSLDSYMTLEEDLWVGGFRLLDVDQRIALPVNIHVRLLITSTDVLHSWSVPALGVKLDACPGRLNQTFVFIKRPGTFYGQCSEICGINHGFMPIVVEGYQIGVLNAWFSSYTEFTDLVH
jgi:cytochrome c oxidase subunit 2